MNAFTRSSTLARLAVAAAAALVSTASQAVPIRVDFSLTLESTFGSITVDNQDSEIAVPPDTLANTGYVIIDIDDSWFTTQINGNSYMNYRTVGGFHIDGVNGPPSPDWGYGGGSAESSGAEVVGVSVNHSTAWTTSDGTEYHESLVINGGGFAGPGPLPANEHELALTSWAAAATTQASLYFGHWNEFTRPDGAFVRHDYNYVAKVTNVEVVPEPGTVVLCGLGLAGAAMVASRRRAAAPQG